MNLQVIAKFLLLIVPLLLSISFHEAAHAYLASKRGDNTAKLLGRMTINPLPHIDIVGSIILPAILVLTGGPFLAAAKPVPVNPLNLKNYKKDNLLISAAGPVSNLILAIGFLILMKGISIVYSRPVVDYYSGAAGILDHPLITIIDYGILLNLSLAFFNLIPIPPLDGSHILEGILPARLSAQFERLQKFPMIGFALILILLSFGILNYLSYPILKIYTLFLGFIL